MNYPPFSQIHSTAKHGTDENLLELRNEIRWLANWAEDFYFQVQSIYQASEVMIGPSRWDDSMESPVRDVVVKLKMTDDDLFSMLELVKYESEK